MTLEEYDAIGQRVAALGSWRWGDGMLGAHIYDGRIVRHRIGQFGPAAYLHAWPDLRDGATMGAALAGLRLVAYDPQAHTRPHAAGWVCSLSPWAILWDATLIDEGGRPREVGRRTFRPDETRDFYGSTEAEALVEAFFAIDRKGKR